MKRQEKNKLINGIFILGIISITIVILASYSAELQYKNNNLITTNEALCGEVDTLEVKIKEANQIQHIERIATKKLGMVKPSYDECVYVSENDKPEGNFAMVIKGNAYN